MTTFKISKEDRKRYCFSKTPVYVLYLLNWIHPMLRERNICRYIMATIVTLIIHICGSLLVILEVYGIATSKTAQSMPIPLMYQVCSQPIFLTINSAVFLFISWFREKTKIILKMLDERQTPFCWSANYKFYILGLMCFSFGALSLKVHVNYNNYVEYDARKIITFHFVDGYIIKNYLAHGFLIYLIYLYSICYMFPVYIAYICICLNNNITTLQCHLSKMKDRSDDVITIFGAFVKQFNDFVSFIEKIDETYRINIGWYIMMLVSIIINSLHSTILFVKCYSIRFQVLSLIIDSISLLLLLLMTSSVYSKVRNVLTKRPEIN